MLSEDQITRNKEQFISLLRGVTREGSNIEGLINKLCSSDFFTAPASTKYHGAFKGGLCRHCLDVSYPYGHHLHKPCNMYDTARPECTVQYDDPL